MGKSVAQAACGSSHTLVLTTKGEIYSFGWGKDGQLGLGATVKDRKSPTLIRTLGDVVKIAACGSHSLALQHSGGLFSWGNNTSGQLGLGHTETCSVPSRITTLQGYTVKGLACAGGVRFGHSVVLVGTVGQRGGESVSLPIARPPVASSVPNRGGAGKDMMSFELQGEGVKARAGEPRGGQGEEGGVVVEELSCGGGEAGGHAGAGLRGQPDAMVQMTARERLVSMGKRVTAARSDHTNGLNRLLAEFEGQGEALQKGKKDCVGRRQELARCAPQYVYTYIKFVLHAHHYICIKYYVYIGMSACIL